MAKTNKSTKARSNKARQAGRVPRPMSFGDAKLAYARLLADPCNGDLVPGPFGDGTGGMVARFEQEYLVQAGVGSTACAFGFIPASLNWTSTSSGTIGDGVPVTFTQNTNASLGPGYNFINANASQFRPLACCMQVYWTGTELNRQGIVSLARVPSEVFNDTGVTIGQLRALSQYVKRTPADMMEIIWRPSEWDLEFVEQPNITTLSSDVRKTALLMTGSGLPTDTPLRVRVVVVYEWVPDPLSGFRVTTSKITTEPTRLANVLAYLDRTGDWMSGTAHAAGKAISSLAGGVGSILALGNGSARLGARLLGV